MDYIAWANAVAITHISSIILVIIGLLICFRYKRFRPWEAGILLVIVVLWSYYGNCPLTILEQHLRDLAGQDANLTKIGFLPFYAGRLLNYNLTSGTVQRATFFTGGSIFAASIEWLAPYLHFHLFSIRKTMRRLGRRFA